MTGEHPVIVVDVLSIDEHIDKIGQSGGKIVMPKMTIDNFGFYAQVSDTEGNVIGI